MIQYDYFYSRNHEKDTNVVFYNDGLPFTEKIRKGEKPISAPYGDLIKISPNSR